MVKAAQIIRAARSLAAGATRCTAIDSPSRRTTSGRAHHAPYEAASNEASGTRSSSSWRKTPDAREPGKGPPCAPSAEAATFSARRASACSAQPPPRERTLCIRVYEVTNVPARASRSSSYAGCLAFRASRPRASSDATGTGPGRDDVVATFAGATSSIESHSGRSRTRVTRRRLMT